MNGGHITGVFWIGETNNIQGVINDVRIYKNEILSPKEIKEISKGLVLHYPLNRGGFGQDNLLLNSTIPTSGSGATGITKYITDDGLQKVVAESPNRNWCTFGNHNTTLPLTKGDSFTFSMMIKSPDSTKKPTVYFRSDLGYYSMQGVMSDNWSIIYYTGTWDIDNFTTNLHLGFSGAPGTYYIKYFKLEKGSIVTPWIPNSLDPLYTQMGLDNNIEYDVSGYGNNGTLNSVSYSANAPRYNVSSVFNGTNSYIKVNSTDWMVQGTEEMTINIWGYMDDWTKWGGGRLFSCTESGGFNLEILNAKMAMSVYVYTNVAKTSTAYIPNANRVSIDYATLSSGWHMFTCIYELSGCKFYVDGVLEDEKEYISYGIYYRTGVPLFLGCEANGANPHTPYFDGMLSDFRLYATALSADDILALYNTPTSIANNGTLLTQGEISEV